MRGAASLELRSDDGSDANPCCAAPSYAATLRGALPALRVLDGASLALADAAATARGAIAAAAVDAAAPAPDDRLGDGFDDAAAPGKRARPANAAAARVRADADRLRAEMDGDGRQGGVGDRQGGAWAAARVSY